MRHAGAGCAVEGLLGSQTVELNFKIRPIGDAYFQIGVEGLKAMRRDAEISGIGVIDKVSLQLDMTGVDGADGKSLRRPIRREFSHLIVRRRIEQIVAALVGNVRIGSGRIGDRRIIGAGRAG